MPMRSSWPPNTLLRGALAKYSANLMLEDPPLIVRIKDSCRGRCVPDAVEFGVGVCIMSNLVQRCFSRFPTSSHK